MPIAIQWLATEDDRAGSVRRADGDIGSGGQHREFSLRYFDIADPYRRVRRVYRALGIVWCENQ